MSKWIRLGAQKKKLIWLTLRCGQLTERTVSCRLVGGRWENYFGDQLTDWLSGAQKFGLDVDVGSWKSEAHSPRRNLVRWRCIWQQIKRTTQPITVCVSNRPVWFNWLQLPIEWTSLTIKSRWVTRFNSDRKMCCFFCWIAHRRLAGLKSHRNYHLLAYKNSPSRWHCVCVARLAMYARLE